MAIVQGDGGAFFRAKDAEALARWYGAHLGLTLTRNGESWWQEFPSKDVEPSLRIATTTFAIFQEDAKHPASPGGSRVNLRVTDLESICSSLQVAGDELDVDADESYGRFARFTDPEGHEIELWQPPARND